MNREKAKQNIVKGLEAFIIPGGFTRVTVDNLKASCRSRDSSLGTRINEYIWYTQSGIADTAKFLGWFYAARKMYEAFL